jgi:hypothetical protein
MTTAVHRLSFDYAQVIGRAFEVLRRNPTLLAALTGLLYLLPKVAATLLDVQVPIIGGAISATRGFDILLAAIGAVMLQAMIVHVFLQDIAGRTPHLKSTLRTGVNRFFPVLFIGLAYALAVLFASVLLLAPGLMVATAWLVAMPAAVAERLDIRAAIERSLWLTRGYRWPVFGLIAITVVVAVAAGQVVDGVHLSWDGSGIIANAFDTAQQVTADILSAVAMLASALLVSSIYCELRLLKEGVAPEDLAEQLD